MSLLRKILLVSLLAVLFYSTATPAYADVVTVGLTTGIASDSRPGGVGTHFHNFGGNSADVGTFSTNEEDRGVSEFNLSGLNSGVALLSFRFASPSGCCGQSRYNGPITIVAYQGDNISQFSDFQAASLGLIGSFDTTGLIVGDVLTFDVTAFYNAALAGGFQAFGVRLAPVLLPDNQAVTFDTFRLNSPDAPSAVPEPATMLLLGTGLAGVAAKVHRRRKARRSEAA